MNETATITRPKRGGFCDQSEVGNTVTMNYNMASQMHQRDYRTLANSPSGTIADSDEFDFDQAGRMTSALSQRYSNLVSMSYDFAGRLATESLDIANQTYTVTREYDQLNRIKKYLYPDGTPVERTYTDRGQLKEIKYNSSVIDTRTYDIGGRLSTSTYSNEAATTWNYRTNGGNKDNLLADITTTNPGANKVGTYAYTWDANKNKTAETITNSPLSGHGFSTGTSGYDDENRVTAWNRTDNNQSQTWNLSLVGDWNTFNQTGTTAVSQTRTHGLTHEFTSFTGTSGGQPANGTLTYDAKGNMLTRPSSLQSPALNLSWDFDNRLIGADTNGTPASLDVTFQYDALGRRISRVESGSTIVYFQAGQQTIADYALGSPAATALYRNVYGSYIDEPVMRETVSGNVKHFYHRNQQYSVTALTDNSGNTAERYSYTAYGALSVYDPSGSPLTTSSLSTRHTYTGREWDAVIKMFYFRARWLVANTGRFTNRDPLGFNDGFGVYGEYLFLSRVDPNGTTSFFQDPQDPLVLPVPAYTSPDGALTYPKHNVFINRNRNSVCNIHVYGYDQDFSPDHGGIVIEWPGDSSGVGENIDGTSDNSATHELRGWPYPNRRKNPIVSFLNQPFEVCMCIRESADRWNATDPSERVRSGLFRNSNWVAKCMLKRCGLKPSSSLGPQLPGWEGKSSKCVAYHWWHTPWGTCWKTCARFQECPSGFDTSIFGGTPHPNAG